LTLEETTSAQETSEETTALYKVDTTVETQTVSELYQYGILKVTTIERYYDVYSDGSKVFSYENSNMGYDFSTYHATTSELLSEASALKSTYASGAQEVLNYVNQYRSEAGVPPLVLDDQLSLAASVRATEMLWSGKFDHIRPDGSAWYSVCADLGIGYSGAGKTLLMDPEVCREYVRDGKILPDIIRI
jgi:uncharacterized protein YkwD